MYGTGRFGIIICAFARQSIPLYSTINGAIKFFIGHGAITLGNCTTEKAI